MDAFTETVTGVEPVSTQGAWAEENCVGIPSLALRPFSPPHLADWAAEITECFAQGKSRTLDLARIVSSAKSSLLRGQWTQLFRAGSLPFSKRKGEMLAVIGKGLGELNTQNFAHFPPAWTALYYLAQLPFAVLETLVADHTIHPALTITEARTLLGRRKGLTGQNSQRLDLKRRLRSLEQFLGRIGSELSDDERQWLQATLRQFAADLDRPHSMQPQPEVYYANRSLSSSKNEESLIHGR
jgi:hypothetical protein